MAEFRREIDNKDKRILQLEQGSSLTKLGDSLSMYPDLLAQKEAELEQLKDLWRREKNESDRLRQRLEEALSSAQVTNLRREVVELRNKTAPDSPRKSAISSLTILRLYGQGLDTFSGQFFRIVYKQGKENACFTDFGLCHDSTVAWNQPMVFFPTGDRIKFALQKCGTMTEGPESPVQEVFMFKVDPVKLHHSNNTKFAFGLKIGSGGPVKLYIGVNNIVDDDTASNIGASSHNSVLANEERMRMREKELRDAYEGIIAGLNEELNTLREALDSALHETTSVRHSLRKEHSQVCDLEQIVEQLKGTTSASFCESEARAALEAEIKVSENLRADLQILQKRYETSMQSLRHELGQCLTDYPETIQDSIHQFSEEKTTVNTLLAQVQVHQEEALRWKLECEKAYESHLVEFENACNQEAVLRIALEDANEQRRLGRLDNQALEGRLREETARMVVIMSDYSCLHFEHLSLQQRLREAETSKQLTEEELVSLRQHIHNEEKCTKEMKQQLRVAEDSARSVSDDFMKTVQSRDNALMIDLRKYFDDLGEDARHVCTVVMQEHLQNRHSQTLAAFCEASGLPVTDLETFRDHMNFIHGVSSKIHSVLESLSMALHIPHPPTKESVEIQPSDTKATISFCYATAEYILEYMLTQVPTLYLSVEPAIPWEELQELKELADVHVSRLKKGFVDVDDASLIASAVGRALMKCKKE